VIAAKTKYGLEHTIFSLSQGVVVRQVGSHRLTLQPLRRYLRDSTDSAPDLISMIVERLAVLEGRSLEKFGTQEREFDWGPGLEDLEEGAEWDLSSSGQDSRLLGPLYPDQPRRFTPAADEDHRTVWFDPSRQADRDARSSSSSMTSTGLQAASRGAGVKETADPEIQIG
jgi:hypothetical protein